MKWDKDIFAYLLTMFLESPDVISCGIDQEYRLQLIQVYVVLNFVHHDRFLSETIMSKAVNNFLSVFQLILLKP